MHPDNHPCEQSPNTPAGHPAPSSPPKVRPARRMAKVASWLASILVGQVIAYALRQWLP
jgi:hypothetical protein